MGTSSVYSSSTSVSNSGQMSTSYQQTGATGAVRNVTNIVKTGANGSPGTPGSINRPYPPSHVESDLIKQYRQLFGLPF